MSLVLNDEQEKALREWYESRRDLEPGEQFSVKIGATKNLLAAIAPLMKNGRVEWLCDDCATLEDDHDMAERERYDADTPPTARPRIVCLCGSTRFMDWFHEAGWQETMAGKIVLSVGCSKHLPADHGGEAMGPDVAARLDELHLRKIDLADELLVLNVDGYVGDSTAREIAYAERSGKPIRWLENKTDNLASWNRIEAARAALDAPKETQT